MELMKRLHSPGLNVTDVAMRNLVPCIAAPGEVYSQYPDLIVEA